MLVLIVFLSSCQETSPLKRKSSIAIASSSSFPLQPEQRGINPFGTSTCSICVLCLSLSGCDFEACGGDGVAVVSIVTTV